MRPKPEGHQNQAIQNGSAITEQNEYVFVAFMFILEGNHNKKTNRKKRLSPKIN